MKKFLTILALCLLLCIALALVACPGSQGVSVKSVQSDPVAALNSAIEKASDGFANDEIGVSDIINAAMEKGSIGVSADLEELLGVSFDYVGYRDMSENQMMHDLDLRVAGKRLDDIKVYMDPDGVIFDAPALTGYNGVLRLDMDAVGELFGPEFDSSVIGTLEPSMSSTFETDVNITKEALDEFFATVGYEVTETTYEGEEIVQLTLNVTTDELVTLIWDYINDSDYDADTKAQTKAAVREELEKMELALNIDFHILKSNGMLIDALLDGSFAPAVEEPGAPDTVQFAAVYKISKTEMSTTLSISTVTNGRKSEVAGLALNVEKTTDGNNLSYTTKLDITTSDVTFHVASLVFEYDKATGDYSLTMTLGKFLFSTPEAYASDPLIALSGELKKTDSKVTLTADTFVIENLLGPYDSSMSLGITLYFEKGSAMPVAPTNPKDIATLTEEERAAIEQYMATLFPSEPGTPLE